MMLYFLSDWDILDFVGPTHLLCCGANPQGACDRKEGGSGVDPPVPVSHHAGGHRPTSEEADGWEGAGSGFKWQVMVFW